VGWLTGRVSRQRQTSQGKAAVFCKIHEQFCSFACCTNSKVLFAKTEFFSPIKSTQKQLIKQQKLCFSLAKIQIINFHLVLQAKEASSSNKHQQQQNSFYSERVLSFDFHN